MIIEKVKIENFGWFVGKHELEFSTNDKKKLNVIIGPNGSGKTQLFNLMSWCLYGQKATQFHENPHVEPLFLSNPIVNNLSNNQTATTKVEMNLIFENKPYVAKVEVRFKKIDGKITVDSKKTKYSKYLDSIFPYPSFIFVNNIGKIIENFNQKNTNLENLDKIIQKMNFINQKSEFNFQNSEFGNIDNKIQLIGNVGSLESQPSGIKTTIDYIFLAAIRDILIPNSVLIVDGPFLRITPEFVIPIYNFLLKHLPQIIFLKTHFHNHNFEINQGRAFELVLNTKYTSAAIKRIKTSKN